MRSGGVLLLLAFLVAAVAAKDSAPNVQEETNDHSTIAPSGFGNIEQHDERSPNTEPKVPEDGGSKNDNSIRMRLTSTYMLVPVFVLLGMVGVCIKLRRMRKQDSYRKLGAAELPVSTGGKKEADQSDRWDDNWGDDWDDEEAQLTPSKPMPNPSSKGLASRRSTKDGWKD